MGVRVPKIRNLAKRIARDDWEAFLRDVPESFEEEMLHGLVIATAPMDAETKISYTEGFLDTIDNWSTCDSFCSAWKFRTEDSGRVYDYFASLMDSGEEYRMRVSLIFRMGHFLDGDHVGDLLDDIVSYRHEGYYYRMGAAWAASFCYVRFPEPTVAALESGRMDDWVRRKSVQKICESYRVSDGEKRALRAMVNRGTGSRGRAPRTDRRQAHW
jgi:3-methyladenine DNA glycosylase AlkD